jgi:hypothetical protein
MMEDEQRFPTELSPLAPAPVFYNHRTLGVGFFIIPRRKTIEHRLPPMRGSAQQEEAVPLDGLGNPVTADGYRAPTDFPRRIFSRQIGAVAVRAECTDGRVALGSEQKYIHA